MPISTTPLIHRNIQVWLADAEDHKIPHGETAIDGNTISTSVSLVKGTDYVIHWCNYPGTAHTVFCEIFIHGKKSRVATHFMDKDKPETQTRSSLGRINALITGSQGNDWLSAPTPSKRAYVELHIRRATGTPTHECVPNPADPAGHLDEIDIELIDDPDDDKDPFIIFRFEFGPATKPEPDRNAIAGPSKSTVPQKRKKPMGDQSPSRSTRRSTQDQRGQVRPDDPVGRLPLSPPNSARQNSPGGHEDLLERINAAREEEKKLDDELEAELHTIKKRIEEKKKFLGQ